MNRVLKFNRVYFILTLVILLIEILIARFAHDQIIRPYFGDFLVVILIYCFVKTFLNTPVISTSIAVLIFSYLVETMQYFHIVNKLGLQHSSVARIIIGTSFEWIDIIAYTCGIAVIILLEMMISKRKVIPGM